MDKAKELRNVVGYDWKTLVPSFLTDADRVFDFDSISSSPDNIRYLLERLTGVHYEVLIRQLSLPHLLEIFATYMSSFALVYAREDVAEEYKKSTLGAIKAGAIEGGTKLVLKQGFGRPYGTNYQGLASSQGTLTDESDLIHIGRGIYLRMITKIPIVTQALKFDSIPFYAEHTFSYFAANSAELEIKQWALGEGLSNFTYVPLTATREVPPIIITPTSIYTTIQMYLNVDIYFKPASPDTAREVITLQLEKRDWPHDRFQYHLQYITFGSYGKASHLVVADTATEETSEITTAIKKIEDELKDATKEAAHSVQSAAENVNVVAERVQDAVQKDQSSKQQYKKDDDIII